MLRVISCNFSWFSQWGKSSSRFQLGVSWNFVLFSVFFVHVSSCASCVKSTSDVHDGAATRMLPQIFDWNQKISMSCKVFYYITAENTNRRYIFQLKGWLTMCVRLMIVKHLQWKLWHRKLQSSWSCTLRQPSTIHRTSKKSLSFCLPSKF